METNYFVLWELFLCLYLALISTPLNKFEPNADIYGLTKIEKLLTSTNDSNFSRRPCHPALSHKCAGVKLAGLGDLRGILIRVVKSGEMLGATER
jgi:hypothetical protein